ncbi:MAG: YbeD family protein [Candidatus Wenzhouxiangella sp. M2_3B_020]
MKSDDIQLDDRGKLRFPCRYPVKAMTRTQDHAIEQVLDAMAETGAKPDRDSVSVRPSRNGRFQSITVDMQADSRRELEAVYERLRALDIVVMTL